ncbi:hypothetical protein FB45DRAFT_243597 [Roridomyces roridus]|uniref:F-box domain-containing protein n=1 Tax=Roridomyces roridus TaxID=1738132 RepID=A0AAD7FC89_9AGAR|nr:hypothetical protein FB45DRAFT_243597 [Roridomyces roridus]
MTTAELRSRLAGIDEQILTLQAERATIAAQLSAAVYPVLSLPTDITSEIFLQYADDVRVYPSTCDPIILSHVCSLWRAVALCTPRLWTRVERERYRSLEELDNCAHLSDFLGMWLSRTGALPLDLHIQLPSPEAPECGRLFGLLADNAARLENLDLHCPTTMEISADRLGPLPFLSKLSLASANKHVLIPEPLDVPRLREVRLFALILPQWQKACLPWSQITVLRFLNGNLGDCMDLVELTPNLEVLEFIDDGQAFVEPIPGPRVLPHLHTLILGLYTDHDILPYLVLPALVDLRFRDDISSLGPFVEDLISRSACSLTSMAFSICESSDVDAMKSCLLLTPALRKLEVTFYNITSQTLGAVFRALRLKKKRRVPALGSLRFYGCETKVPLPSLVEMLTSRRNEGSLRLFKMTVNKYGATDVPDPGVEDQLEQWRALGSGGLELEISSQAQWLDEYLF